MRSSSMSSPRIPQGRNAWLVAMIGALALLLCVPLGWAAPAQAWAGYVAAYLFWLGLALGALALSMIHVLTGGGWGENLRPQLFAAMCTLPVLALALLPMLLGAGHLFPWLRLDAVDAQQFARQAWYLNEPFLLARAVVFTVLWLLLAWAMTRRLAHVTQRGGAALAVFGLVIYAISASLFGVDWVMALEPRWHSSVFGMTFISVQLLGALACAVCFASGSATGRDHGHGKHRLGDFGNLLLALLLLSAYLIFMDYLTAWTGDLPSETVWYIPRTLTTWKWLAVLVIGFGLVLPFALLLSKCIKRSVRGLHVVTGMLLLADLGFMLWLVLPSVRPNGLWFHPVDGLAFLGLGALCWSVFAGAHRRALERDERRAREAST